MHVSKNSSITLKIEKSIKKSKRESSFIVLRELSKTGAFDHLIKSLQAEEVSRRASDLITNSEYTGSLKHYKLAWR